MRSWLRAMKPLSVLPRQLSVGGRSVLFTDKSLIDGEPISPKETTLKELEVVKASSREVEVLKNGGYIK
jgi:hypothetical protein